MYVYVYIGDKEGRMEGRKEEEEGEMFVNKNGD